MEGLHWKADNSRGEKVVRHCFPDKREQAANTVVKVHEMQQADSVDLPDLQYITSVLMRTLETPLKLQEMQLKRRASCPNAVPELRWDFQYQEMREEVFVEVDSDWVQSLR